MHTSWVALCLPVVLIPSKILSVSVLCLRNLNPDFETELGIKCLHIGICKMAFSLCQHCWVGERSTLNGGIAPISLWLG